MKLAGLGLFISAVLLGGELQATENPQKNSRLDTEYLEHIGPLTLQERQQQLLSKLPRDERNKIKVFFDNGTNVQKKPITPQKNLIPVADGPVPKLIDNWRDDFAELKRQPIQEQVTLNIAKPLENDAAIIPEQVKVKTTEELTGELYYLMEPDGDEVLNLSQGRLWFKSGTVGTFYDFVKPFDFSWVVNDEGFIEGQVDEDDQVETESYVFDSELGRQVRRLHKFVSFEVKIEDDGDNNKRLVGQQFHKLVYPDGEKETVDYVTEVDLSAVGQEGLQDISSLLPVDVAFNIPVTFSEDLRYMYGDSSVSSYVNLSSVRVSLSEKTATSAVGTWRTPYVNDSGQLEYLEESITVDLSSTGKALFRGDDTGWTVDLAFIELRDGMPLVNTTSTKDDPEQSRSGSASLLSIKNPDYKHEVPGIYWFKQNGWENDYFWTQLNEDKTGITVSVWDQNGDGILARNEFVMRNVLWDSTSDGRVEIRRYYYASGSGKYDFCLPENFTPSSVDQCQLESSRLINFYDEKSLDGKKLVTTDHEYMFYANSWLVPTPAELQLTGVSTDNRYFYTPDQAPVTIPDAPPNDNFADAQDLDLDGEKVSGNNLNATREKTEYIHGNSYGKNSVWYRIVPTVSSALTLQVDALDFDATIAVYTGDSINQLSPLGWWTEREGGDIGWYGDIEAGQTYYVVIDSYSNNKGGSFELSWKDEPLVPIVDIEFKDSRLEQCVAETGEVYAEHIGWLNCTGVEDLTGIEYLKNISWLYLLGYDTVLGDLTPLTALKKLEYLGLPYNKLTDSAFLKLSGLRSEEGSLTLYLGVNQLTEASIPVLVELLSGYERSGLELFANNFTSMAGLGQLDKLYFVDITLNPLRDPAAAVSQFKDQEQMQYMGANSINLSSFEGVLLPPNLTGLSVEFNPFSDLDNLMLKLRDDILTDLRIGRSQVADLSPLSKFTQLTNLSLQGLHVEDLKQFELMSDLFEFNLSGATVYDISPLNNFSSLRYLSLSGASVDSLKPLYGKYLNDFDITESYNLRCDDIESYIQSVNYNVWIRRPSFCNDGNNKFSFSELWGASVSGVTFMNAADAELYGKLTYENGVLTFKPKNGVTGWINVNIRVQFADGGFSVLTLRIYVEEKQRSKLPIWLYLEAAKLQ